MATPKKPETGKQLLHLVFGGVLTDLASVQFQNLDELDIVGIYPDYASAYDAWKGVAQRSVDNAHMRYFIVHMHRLLDPELDECES
jgi:hypothetical protein